MKKEVGIMVFAAALVLSGTVAGVREWRPFVPNWAGSALAAEAVPSDIKADYPHSEYDIGKIYLVKHEMTLALKSDTAKASLDGTAIQVDPARLRDGQLYISLRTLKLSGVAASVGWDTQRQEASVSMKPELAPSWPELTFLAGHSGVLTPNGTMLDEATIPKLFLTEGRVYIPVKSLALLGLSASLSQDQLVLEWSEKRFDINEQLQESRGEQATFSVLYEQELAAPQVLTAYGSGAWGGSSGLLIGSEIDLDGRLYNRMEYTVELRPGVNPLRLYAGPGPATADLSMTRTVGQEEQIPVSFTEQGEEHIELTQPESGYVRLNAGEGLILSGRVKGMNSNLDELTIRQQKYESGDNIDHTDKPGYKMMNTTNLSISEAGQFSSEVLFPEPGDYLLQIYSPRYIPMPQAAPSSVLWAELVVKVE